MNMNDLEKVRSQAIGVEADETYLKKYPVKEKLQLSIPTRHGDAVVFLYKPLSELEVLPAIVNFHGGGFVKGYRGRDVEFAQTVAVKGTCLVFDVDYKIAPEYQYPYALEEGYDVFLYLQNHMKDYGGDRKRIALTGQSAGANLAVGISMMLKQAGERLPVCAICCYPPCDLYTDPMEKSGGSQDLERCERGRLYNNWYVPAGREKEPYVSPVFATKTDLCGLEPFTVLAAELDPLCAEGLELAAHMVDAGVTVTTKKAAGAKHGFLVSRTTGYEVGEQLFFQTLKTYFQ